MIFCLEAPLRDGALQLDRLDEMDREALRMACMLDPTIWSIYYRSFLDPNFDTNFDDVLIDSKRVSFTIRLDTEIVGMSSFLDMSRDNRTLEIGTTYLVPEQRGTGINGRAKRLMLDRAFGCGIERAEFKVDVRNARSQAAMIKLGAVREGVLRRHLITWNGHVRDSAIFSILRDEWQPAR